MNGQHEQHSAVAKIDRAGRLQLPAKMRRLLGIKPGDDVKLTLEHGVLTVWSLDDAVRHAQEIVRIHNPQSKSMVDELLDERRRAAAKE